MQTYSHLIVAALLARGFNGRRGVGEVVDETTSVVPAFGVKSFLFGSVAPDIPLILLTVAFLANDLLSGTLRGGDSSVEHLFRFQFFYDPWVITAHNLFHAPLLIVLYGAVGYAAWRRGRRWGPALFWFAAGCMLHTLIDIPLHYDDGPLVFYPLNWQVRFYSPVSYWDPRRFGIQVAIMEHLMAAGIAAYLAMDWRRGRRMREDDAGG